MKTLSSTGGIILSVKVIPKSSKDEISSFEGEILKVKLTTAPEKGKANRALVELLSRTFGLRRSDIEIIKGATAQRKLLKIKGLSRQDILEKLKGLNTRMQQG